MNTSNVSSTLATLFAELVNGAPETAAYMLNQGDPGMLRSLDRLSASAASAVAPGGSSIAAHVDHVRYGLSLMNRWANGEANPFASANWSTSWQKTTYSDTEWTALRAALRDESHRWLDALAKARDVSTIELNGVIGSIAHFAYHLGAIRQMDRAIGGPKDTG